MRELRLEWEAEVEFTADSMHFDSEGNLWSKLANAMVVSYSPKTGAYSQPFGEERFRGVWWAGDTAFLVRRDNSVVSFELRTRQLTELARFTGTFGPILANTSENWCVVSHGSGLRLFSLDGTSHTDYELDFEPMSLAFTRNRELWVGGDGLDVVDLATGRTKNLREDLPLPVLQIAYDCDREIVACAGGTLELFSVNGESIAQIGESLFRCQFAPSGTLITRTQTGKEVDLPPKLAMRAVKGIVVCEISDVRAFLFHVQNGKEKLFISEHGKLFQFG